MRVVRNQVVVGDALGQMRHLPDAVIDSIVTSPPYFRLRDYGVSGQVGLEAHVDEWVKQLLAVLHEAARVLVPTGIVFLNLGDSFSAHQRQGASRKCLLLAPERLALALTGTGWILRNKIVWAKPNTIPSSVRDRLSTRHEIIYLLARQPRYYFDLDALRVPHASRAPQPRVLPRRSRPAWLGPNSDGDRGLDALRAAGIQGHPLGKNPGDVWQVAVNNYRGGHHAAFPLQLAERMVVAGTPERRCTQCRTAYERPLHRLGAVATRLALRAMCDCHAPTEPGLVLDPFMGSGTTAVAAEKLGRDWLGFELNPDFVTVANRRISHARDERRIGEPRNSNRKEVT